MKATQSFNGKTPRPAIVCHCADRGCPVHRGMDCTRHQTHEQRIRRVYRIDMDDRTGTPMCPQCAEDALGSGLFTTR